jgi:hypothetical protein
MALEPSPHILRTGLSPGWVLRVHLVCIAVLALAHVASLAALSRIDPVENPGLAAVAGKFVLDSEVNIPTWFQSASLLLSSLALAIIVMSLWREHPAESRWWAALAILFFGLSLEETIGFHELLIIPLRERLELHGIWHFAWVVPGLMVVAALGLAFAGFWWRLPIRTRSQMALAAGIYLVGAVGMEMVGGLFAEQAEFRGTLAEQAHAGIPYLISATVEEVLEMVGIAVWLYALLSWLEGADVRLTMRFSARVDRGRRTSAASQNRLGGAAGFDRENEPVCV